MTDIGHLGRNQLFHSLFGSPERKELSLELYNAVNLTGYRNPEDLLLDDLEGEILLQAGGEVPLLVLSNVTLCGKDIPESDNTCRMQMQFLMYFIRLHQKYIRFREQEDTAHGDGKRQIPPLQFVIFHNAEKEASERILELGDAFVREEKPGVRLRVRLLNIGAKNASGVLDRCRALRDYAFLVEAFRRNGGESGGVRAVNDAMEKMSDGPVRSYLQEHRSRVIGLLLTECEEEQTEQNLQLELWHDGQRDGMDAGLREGLAEGLRKGREAGLREGRQIGRKEGYRKGRREGALEAMLRLVQRRELSVATAAACLRMSEAEFRKRLG